MNTIIAVIGAGSWGTAIAKVLAENGHEIRLWVFEKDLCEIIREKRENTLFLPDVRLPENITPTDSFNKALAGVKSVVVVVPSQYVRNIVTELLPFLSSDASIISSCKGIENKTLLTVSQIIKEIIPEKLSQRLAVLSGPTFAREIALQRPAAASIACADSKTAEYWRKLFSTLWFKIFINTDPIGVELGGALKNVIAIAAGISDGLGLGNNARAALITRGLMEISRLGAAMGAQMKTFLGLAGVGDLVLTCTGDLSRNRKVGLELAKGKSIHDIQKEMTMIAEGVKTVRSAYQLGKQHNMRVSIIDEVYSIIYENKDIHTAISDLLKRDIIEEF